MIFQSVEQVRVIPKPVMEPALEREVGTEDVMSKQNNGRPAARCQHFGCVEQPKYLVVPPHVGRDEFLAAPRVERDRLLACEEHAGAGLAADCAVIRVDDFAAYQRVLRGQLPRWDKLVVPAPEAPAAEAKPRKRGRRGGKKHGKPAERPATDNVVDLVSAAPSLDESAEATGTQG